MIDHYRALKTRYPNCIVLIRSGATLTTYGADAATVALTCCLTTKHTRREGTIVSIPFADAERHIATLVRTGHKVAMAEQTAGGGAGEGGRQID